MDSTLHNINMFLPLSWNNAQLAQFRLDWERQSVNSWHLYRSPDADELIVLVERWGTRYSLNHYFISDAGTWWYHIPVRDDGLDMALSHFEAYMSEKYESGRSPSGVIGGSGDNR